MAAQKKKRGKTLWAVLLIAIAIVLAVSFVAYDEVKERVVSAMMEKVFEDQAANDPTGQAQNAQNIYNNMSDEDKETVNQLIEDKVSPETISNVSNYVKNQDKEGLKQYISQEFTPEEIQQIKDLYQKYK